MPFLTPCLVCGELTRQTSYCPAHRPIKVDSPERKAKKAAMYGGDYRRRARAVKSSATHCHLCNKPFEWGDTVEADHLIPGEPTSPLAPAHRKCNQQRGNTPLP